MFSVVDFVLFFLIKGFCLWDLKIHLFMKTRLQKLHSFRSFVVSHRLLSSGFKRYLDMLVRCPEGLQTASFKKHLFIVFFSGDLNYQWDLGYCGDEVPTVNAFAEWNAEKFLSQLIAQHPWIAVGSVQLQRAEVENYSSASELAWVPLMAGALNTSETPGWVFPQQIMRNCLCQVLLCQV